MAFFVRVKSLLWNGIVGLQTANTGKTSLGVQIQCRPYQNHQRYCQLMTFHPFSQTNTKRVVITGIKTFLCFAPAHLPTFRTGTKGSFEAMTVVVAFGSNKTNALRPFFVRIIPRTTLTRAVTGTKVSNCVAFTVDQTTSVQFLSSLGKNLGSTTARH